MQDAWNWWDKDQLAEKDEFEAKQKELEGVPADIMISRQVLSVRIMRKICAHPQVQSMDRVVNMPVAAQHQVPTVQCVQRTVAVPNMEFIDKVVDAPRVMQGQVSTVEARDDDGHRADGSHLQATSDQEWAQELHEIRRLVEFFARRDRKFALKTDVAARWLKRLERKAPSWRTRSQPGGGPRGQDHRLEVDCQQVAC